jgi:hypothetical protein
MVERCERVSGVSSAGAVCERCESGVGMGVSGRCVCVGVSGVWM